jgi:hypothetical protein
MIGIVNMCRRSSLKSVAEHLLCLCKSTDKDLQMLADLHAQCWEVRCASEQVMIPAVWCSGQKLNTADCCASGMCVGQCN